MPLHYGNQQQAHASHLPDHVQNITSRITTANRSRGFVPMCYGVPVAYHFVDAQQMPLSLCGCAFYSEKFKNR
jgi:hypothetical protein